MPTAASYTSAARPTRREYALKVVSIDAPEDQKFLDQAQHEFRVAQMLDHPNLVKMYALEEEKDWLSAAQGPTAHRVRQRQDARRRAGAADASWCSVFERVADGLVHMHRRGVCHADLKPNNSCSAEPAR